MMLYWGGSAAQSKFIICELIVCLNVLSFANFYEIMNEIKKIFFIPNRSLKLCIRYLYVAFLYQ